MRIALICDWLTGMRGGERCLEAAYEIYPQADIFTLVHFPGTVSKIIESHKIYTSYIQKLPGDINTFRRYLPLFGNAIQQFDLKDYDLIISFNHCVAKGIKVPKNIPHICYCHTPMRYAWFMREEYLSSYKGLKKWAAGKMLDYLKNWDIKNSNNVTNFIANSRNVQNRIKYCYNRDSVVIYPPVDTDRFPLSQKDDGYYLIVSALVPYKRIDLAINAFNKLSVKLMVVGNGPELKRLKKIASKNISFIKSASDSQISHYMQKCSALIFPGEEDFGIVPLEAQSCGKAVIAFAKGGALETVIDSDNENATGIFFSEQNPISLSDAVEKFEENKEKFKPDNCRLNALKFDRSIYKQSLQKYIQNVIQRF